MSNSALAEVIQLHPSTESLDAVALLAARFLRAKRALAEAETIIAAVGPELVKALTEAGNPGVAVAGLGAVKLVDAAPQSRLDQKAAVALLEKASIKVPRVEVGGGLQLRPTLV